MPQREKQHAGPSQSSKQPDVEESHLPTHSFSSSSGDDSDEMYIAKTTPKKVHVHVLIIVYDLLLSLYIIVCTCNLQILLLCTGYYHL